ncbi:MAG: hypothetical protein Q8934_05680 [Bacillota bacterium]|nr:hypothetical protein [Bacillota bacterium]
MSKDNQYVTAELSPNLITEIKSFEEKLRNQTHKNVVLIAYEKDNHLLD